MHVVDQPGGEEVAYDGGAAADPDVPAIGCFAGGLERLGRGGVQEVERGAALHLDRGPRAVREHEGRCVERRVRAPPAPPVRVVPPASQNRVPNIHSCRRSPAWPNGASADCGSPVAKPSREMDKLWIRVSDIRALLDW